MLRDDHDDWINDIMTRLTQLSHGKSSPTVAAPSMGIESAAEPTRLLRTRLDYMEGTLRSINSNIESLTPGPDLDTCVVRQLEEQVGRVNTEHSDLTRDILSLEHGDCDLLGLSSAFSKTLFDLSVRIKRLLRDWAAPPSTRAELKGGSNC